MLEADDFHFDNVLLRQIKQAAKQAARDQEDDDDNTPAPRGTQRNRPAEIGEEEDSVDVDEERRQTIARVKKERQQSRGPSMAPAQDEIEEMETD